MVSHGERGAAQADFEGFTEGGAPDDMDGRAGDQTEFPEPGEVRGIGREAENDGGAPGREFGKGNWSRHGLQLRLYLNQCQSS